MEHTRIAPAGASPAGADPLPPELLDTLAADGLRELLFAPIPKVARALAGFDRVQLGIAIEVMIAMLDAADGDPDADTGDAEDEPLTEHALRYGERGPGCGASDGGDISVTEWHTRGRNKDNPGLHDHRLLHEDDEDDDPAGQYDEDHYSAKVPKGHGAGCTISDPDYCTAGDDRIVSGPVVHGPMFNAGFHPGSDDDDEREQMVHDVPVLPVYSAEHNIFTDERVPLGMSNLMTSFQTNGGEVRSADTGRVLVTNAHGTRVPGTPV